MPTIPGQRFAGKHNNLPKVSDPEDKDLIPQAIATHEGKLSLWTFLINDLRSRNLWSSTYTLLLQEAVETSWRLTETRRHLDHEGEILEKVTITRQGDTVVTGTVSNPRFSQMTSLQTHLLKLIEKLGMSPRDIVFLLQTDPSTPEIFEAEADVREKVHYFR